MVKLTSIVTKTGDAGETGLGYGQRISKSSTLIDAMGDVDEANASLGVAITALTTTGPQSDLKAHLTAIQNDLFDLGSDLCRLDPKAQSKLTENYVDRLDQLAEDLNTDLAPLTSFILPGGSIAAAHLHMARTIVRRAERSIWCARNDYDVNPVIAKYLNRLSDVLFLMARVANDGGKTDVLWQPGANA